MWRFWWLYWGPSKSFPPHLRFCFFMQLPVIIAKPGKWGLLRLWAYKGERKVFNSSLNDRTVCDLWESQVLLLLPRLLLERDKLYWRENKTVFKLYVHVYFFKNSHRLKIPMYKILQSCCHPSFSLQLNVRPKSELYILAISLPF